MRRDFLILFLLPVVSMPQTENSLSTNSCEAGAEIRSRATSGMTELYKLRLRGLGRSPSLENVSVVATKLVFFCSSVGPKFYIIGQ